MQQPKFWLGCFAQPMESFSKWKNDGVNIVIQPAASTLGTTPQIRRKAAADLGLFYMDVPDGATTDAMIQDAVSMINDPACYAICLSDEPSENEPWYTTPEAAKFVADYLAKWKPVFDGVTGRKTIWANFGGNRITSGRPDYAGQMVIPYVDGCHVTEIGYDSYPINYNTAGNWTQWNARTDNAYNGGHDPLIIPGENVQQWTYRCLKSFCPTASIWAYLEVSHIQRDDTTGRMPTGSEVLQEADALVKMGVKGLIYFSHSFGHSADGKEPLLPWDPSGAAGTTEWDGRGADQVTACRTLAAKLNGNVVNPPVPPPPTTDLTALTSRVSALETQLAFIKANAVNGVTVTVSKGF